jgi:hypothetical protein
MSNFITKLNGLIWTLAGTALVLITLSGETKRIGLFISGGALLLNLIGMAFESDDD